MPSKPVIIIGTGLAGYSTAKEFRKLDTETPLKIYSADSSYAYSKPMLSNALGRGQAPMDLPQADAGKMSETLNATIEANTTVSAISPDAHTIEVDGQWIEYKSLVLALGADQAQPPFSGDATQDVLSINDLDEYVKFRDIADKVKHVGIIGAGLIGSEFANDLISGEYTVDVIEPIDHPLGRLVPGECGNAVKDALEKLGARWHLGRTCDQVDHAGSGYRLTLSDESVVNVDMVLSAVGLVPRTAMASAAGLTVNKGIVVDRNLQTSAPDIYALGDCMEVEGLVLPFIMPIMHASRALGKTLAGDTTRLNYPVMPVVVKTPAHPVVVSAPAPDSAGSWDIDVEDDGVRAIFRDATTSAPIGFVLTGAKVKEKMALAKELPPVLS